MGCGRCFSFFFFISFRYIDFFFDFPFFLLLGLRFGRTDGARAVEGEFRFFLYPSFFLYFFFYFPCFFLSWSSVRSCGWCMCCGRCVSFFFFMFSLLLVFF